MSICCLPFWTDYVTAFKQEDDCCGHCINCVGCSYCTYCFCGSDNDSRVECCKLFWFNIDNCLKWTFCCPYACYTKCDNDKNNHKLEMEKQKYIIELNLLNAKQEHELKILKLNKQYKDEQMSRNLE